MAYFALIYQNGISNFSLSMRHMKIMKMLTDMFFILSLVFTPVAWGVDLDQLEKNKALVVKFYEMAFFELRGAEAAELYLSKDYIQHNPYTETGREAFINYVTTFAQENPNTCAGSTCSEIKRIIAEGDLVVLHVHGRLSESDRGRAIVDIFRVENNKIVEHWDVIQDVPEVDLSGNTMF